MNIENEDKFLDALNLSKNDIEYLKQTSERLGISTLEILKNGLKLMILYNEAKNELEKIFDKS